MRSRARIAATGFAFFERAGRAPFLHVRRGTVDHSPPARLVFDRAPLRVYWEITRACSLACRHCRAEASPSADPRELRPDEGMALLERIAAFGDPKPHVVLTGGDPLERRDLFALIAHARSLGLAVSVSPSATPKLTPHVVQRLADAGVEAISLSVDRSSAGDHDALRGVAGCFDRTIAAGRRAAEVGLKVQVNTLVSAETADDLPAVYRLVTAIGAARWSLFFLVTVGRGAVLEAIDGDRATRLLEWLASLPRGPGDPVVTTTEAPHFRRTLLERRRLPSSAAARAGFGVRDGNGVAFVSHTGDVSPSGFLPLSAGNVREDDFVAIYRSSPMFVALRDGASFGGRCGACGYHAICGGSRARAWAASGDMLGEDPLCTYPVAAPAMGGASPFVR
jgi:MoaA/NifB/PqqE/SkfB family radical SAM enzyme